MEKIKIRLLKFIGFLLIVTLLIGGGIWINRKLDESLNQPLTAICQGTQEECYSQNPMCKTFSIEGKDCIRDGRTGGFFDHHIYYVCKGYGKMTNTCQDYYSYEEFQEQLRTVEVQGR